MTEAYHLNNIKVNTPQRCILNIDDLTIPANKCITLLGDNGAGKSTLLNLLAFTSRPDEGDVSLFGQAVTWPLARQYRQKIAFVAQQPYLLPGSVYDNIKLALTLQHISKSRHRDLIQQALEQTQLTHLASQAANTLSGGELKRVAIARAIAYQPDILLLDEPFSHLDTQHIQILEQQLHSFSQHNQKTVIFSTHDRLQGIAIAEQSINLIEGKITSAPLINVFNGHLKQQQFITANITIQTTSTRDDAQHIAIAPNQIIVSVQPLKSSMQNSFQGRLTLIAETEESASVRLTVDCGEKFHVTISIESLQQLQLTIGDTLYLSFKSTAITVF